MWYLIVVLTSVHLMFSDIEHLFVCLLAISYVFFEKCLFRAFAHFFNKWGFLILNRMSSLCILDIKPLLSIYWIVCKYFIPFSRWALHFKADSFIDCIKAFYHDIVPFICYVKSFDFFWLLVYLEMCYSTLTIFLYILFSFICIFPFLSL